MTSLKRSSRPSQSHSSTSHPAKKPKTQPKPPIRSNRPTIDHTDAPSSSNDEHDDQDGSDDEDDQYDRHKTAMLKMLEAHGRAMFGEVVLPATAVTSSTSKGKGRALNSGQTNDTDEEMDNEDDEWDDDVDEDVEDRDDGDYDDDEEQDQDSIGDDGEILVDSTPAVISGAGSSRAPEVVFAPQIGRSQSSNADYKSFMSSKVSKVVSGPTISTGGTKKEQDVEKNNLSLDKTLHSLLLTSLLPSSLDQNSATALKGRLSELAGAAKLGTGEREAKRAELGKLGGSRVGTGLRTVGKQRWEKGLADARERGDNGLLNSHTTPSIYASSSPAALAAAAALAKGGRKEKDRGLTNGVGRYQNGVLKLSQGDMDGVKRDSERRERSKLKYSRGRGGRGGGRGRGGSRGRGK